MAPPPSDAPTWVILCTVPRVQDDGAADLSLSLATPPRVPAGPCILSNDPSGLLFLLTPPPASPDDPPAPSYLFPDPDNLGGEVLRYRTPWFFVLDVPSATASRVHDPAGRVSNPGNIGVIAAPGGGYVLAEFQPHPVGYDDEATLLRFSSRTAKWVAKDVANPPPGWTWTFSQEVVSHAGKLWWVDSEAGLLTCDPFAARPTMTYIPLPGRRARGGRCRCCSKLQSGVRRVVYLSDGKFRCVEIGCPSQGVAQTVTVRTLAQPRPDPAEWTMDYRMSVAELWADDTFKAAGLPEKGPAVMLVHSKDPRIVYLGVENYLLAVDMRARKVLDCAAHDLASDGIPRGCVYPWVLPPRAGREASDNGVVVKEEEQSSITNIYLIPTHL
ncbi:hypothetical protein QOZ80_1AG0027520 [Eleusine coracana subsp. coracana]|nr:hypothetical protein QOZ80_1AG0027520 [Eleusine coracana subsp. coracana]